MRTTEFHRVEVEANTGRVFAEILLRDSTPGQTDKLNVMRYPLEPDEDTDAVLDMISAKLQRDDGYPAIPSSVRDTLKAHCAAAHTPAIVKKVRAAKAEARAVHEAQVAREAEEQAAAEARAAEVAAEAKARYEADVLAMAETLVAKLQSDKLVDAKA